MTDKGSSPRESNALAVCKIVIRSELDKVPKEKQPWVLSNLKTWIKKELAGYGN